MKTPKTIELIECRKCSGQYFSGSVRVTLLPGNENELPDEVYVIVRKVAACASCKEREDRTQGGRRKKFER
jgi:ribosomal protein L44E